MEYEWNERVELANNLSHLSNSLLTSVKLDTITPNVNDVPANELPSIRASDWRILNIKRDTKPFKRSDITDFTRDVTMRFTASTNDGASTI